MMYERTVGPIRGYHLAAYACPVGEHGRQYVGYFKVFGEAPSEGFFDRAVCLLKGCAADVLAEPGLSLDAAIDAAKTQVMNLPDADQLMAAREKRRMYFWEAMQFGVTR